MWMDPTLPLLWIVPQPSCSSASKAGAAGAPCAALQCLGPATVLGSTTGLGSATAFGSETVTSNRTYTKYTKYTKIRKIQNLQNMNYDIYINNKIKNWTPLKKNYLQTSVARRGSQFHHYGYFADSSFATAVNGSDAATAVNSSATFLFFRKQSKRRWCSLRRSSLSWPRKRSPYLFVQIIK